jgi:abequosyltransferase
MALRLSICIATLNRAAFIGDTLESLVSQVTDEVEIVIVDGASTDNTEEIVRRYAAKCPTLRYIRLDKKGGVDRDYCRTIEHAQGEYCWLFTDDDLLKPGAVAAVLEATRKQYSLIVVNAEVRTADLTVCLQDKRIKHAQDEVYQAASPARDQFLAVAGDYLSFIGGVVIRREVWQQRNYETYLGTEFVHVGVIFQRPLPGPALVMANPWIIIRYGNAQWVSRHFEIWMFKWPGIIWSATEFSEWAKQKVVPREPWRCWQRLLLYRAMERYSRREYDQWIAPRLKSSWRKMLGQAIALAPVALFNRLADWYVRLAVGNAPCITRFDLEAWRKQRAKR